MSSAVFVVRGNSFTARYSNGGPTGALYGIAGFTPQVIGDPGSITGSSLAWASGNTTKGVSYAGRRNTPNGRVWSAMIRIRTGYDGSSATQQGFFSMSSGGGRFHDFSFGHSTAGNLHVLLRNESNVAIVNTVAAGPWPATRSAYTDITVTVDGNAAGSNWINVYANTSIIGTIQPTGALSPSWDNTFFSEISLGGTQALGTMNSSRIEEFALFDYVIDVNNAPLVGGAGPLSGPARTALIDVPALDGSVYTNPGAANVKLNEAYTFAGSAIVGSYAAAGGGGSFVFVG